MAGDQVWRRWLRGSRGLREAARVAGAFAPPVGWAYIGVTLDDPEWESLSGADRAMLAAAAVEIPLGTLVALVVAVWAFADRSRRGDLMLVFAAAAALTFAMSLAIRRILSDALGRRPG